jgi:protein CpxP
MKKLTVLLIGLALFSVSANPVNAAQEKVKKTAEQRATALTEKMEKALMLTPAQKTKVAELNLGIAKKNEAIRNDVTMTKETKKQSLEGNRTARNTSLKTILTPEQYTKYEAMEAKIKEKRQLKKEEIKKSNNKLEEKKIEIEELEEL